MITAEDIEAFKEDQGKPSRFFVHSNKESARESFEDASADKNKNPVDSISTRACYAGYEVEFHGYWDFSTGDFWATHVMGTKLEKPTRI